VLRRTMVEYLARRPWKSWCAPASPRPPSRSSMGRSRSGSTGGDGPA